MGAQVRKTAIDIVGDVPWGTHFCQFYQTREDLIDTLVPYFKAGLENNEFCMWITAEPLIAEDAESALKKKVKNLDDYIKKGQIEILDYSQWYLRSGRFDSDRVLRGWVEKEQQALERGFDGLRLTGNTFWLEKRDWKDFTDYEAAVNSVIGKYRMLAICTYCLDKCTAPEIIDVISNHQFALIKRKGKWEIIESAEYKKTVEALRDSEEKFRLAFENAVDAIFWADPETGLITNCNKAAEILLEKKRKDIIGQHQTMVHPPEKSEYYSDIFKKHAEQEEVFNGDVEIITKSGKIKPVNITASVTLVGGKPVMQGIFHDITEREQIEEALQESKRQLSIRNSIAEIFLTTPDDEMYGEVLQVLLEAMESKYGIFGYIDENGALVCPSMTRDIWDQCQVPDKTIVFPREKWGGIWGRALIEKKTLYANEGLHVPEGHVPITKVLVVPVMYGGQVIGLLEVANKPTDYSHKDQEFLEIIAGKIAPILNARLQRDRQRTQRRRIEEALRKSEKRYRELYEGSQDGYVLTDMKANIIEFNSAYKNMLGYPEKELLQKKYADLTPPKWHAVEAKIIKEQILKRGYSEIYEKEYIRKDGTVFPIELRVYLARDEKDKPIGMWAFIRDIRERKQAEARQLLTEKILRCLNQDKPSLDMIVDILTLIKEATGFEAVGIRLREGDDFPYFAVQGFSAEFVQAENYLCARDENGQVIHDAEGRPLLECMCGNILSARTDPALPFFTEGGSFWTNSTTMLLASTSEQERQGRTRNRCNQDGYESVALIPLRSGEQIVGLLQLNDTRWGQFTPEMIRFFEGIGASIGIALARIKDEQALREARDGLEQKVQQRTAELSRTVDILQEEVKERTLAQQALQQSEVRLRDAQRIAHIGNWDWDIVNNQLWWSDEIYHIFGLRPQEFDATYEAFLSHVHPDDREFVKKSVNEALYERKPYSIDHRVVRPDGTERIVHEQAEVIRNANKSPVRMRGTVQDVTAQKQAEEKILDDQKLLRSLTAELLLSEERERRKIAADLHDSVGQILAFSDRELGTLQKSAPQKLMKSVEEIRHHIKQAVKQTQTLTFDLSPPSLYDLGFEAAVEELIEQFSKERKIECHFESCGQRKPIADHIKILLYRSIRELLTNVAKHSTAKLVRIALSRVNNNIVITVEDDGTGFDISRLERKAGNSKGFGLFSIRERLTHIGGQFDIQSGGGKGTKITLLVPLKLKKLKKRRIKL